MTTTAGREKASTVCLFSPILDKLVYGHSEGYRFLAFILSFEGDIGQGKAAVRLEVVKGFQQGFVVSLQFELRLGQGQSFLFLLYFL